MLYFVHVGACKRGSEDRGGEGSWRGDGVGSWGGTAGASTSLSALRPTLFPEKCSTFAPR